MASIAEIRSKYPQYNDLSDEQLAQGLHKKYYSDIPFDEYSKKIGLSASIAAPKPERSAWEDFAKGGGRILTERGLGIIQLLDEATGGALLSPEARQATYTASKKLQDESKDEGTIGTIASIAADPLNALPFGGVGKGIKALAAGGAAAGAISGGLKGKTSEDESRLGNLESGAATGAVVGPIVGKAVDVITSPIQTAKNIGAYAGKALGVVPENVKTFDLAGIEPTLGDVTSSNVIKRGQNSLKNIPIASSIIGTGEKRVADQAETALANVGYSPNLEKAVGGDAAKEGLQAYTSKGKALFNKAFNEYDNKFISKGESTPIMNTYNKILEIAQRADTPEAYDAYLGATEKDIINKIKTAVTDPTSPELSYNDTKLFRTAIGKKLEDYTIGSSDKAVLRELYGTLSADMRDKAAQKSPDALKAFDRLNSNYAKFIGKLDDTVNGVVNKGEATEIFNAVKSGLPLPERTGKILSSLPQDKRDIVRGSLIHEMGTDRTMAGQGQFNPARFAANFKKLDPKAQKAFLIGVPNDVKNNFLKVVDAAGLAAKTALQDNPSGTFKGEALGASVIGLLNPATSALTAKLIAGGAITAKMMTSPKFIKWLANAPKQSESGLAQYIAKLSAIAASDKDNEDDIKTYQQQISPVTQQPQPATEAPPVATPEAPQSDLFKRVIHQESRGKQSAVSPKGAIGVSQIMPGTAREAAKLAGLPYDEKKFKTDANYNAALGKAYLDHLLSKYDGNEKLALIAYNWGMGNADKWIKRGANLDKLPKETKNYIKNILREA